MVGQGFHAKSFRGVVAAVENVQAQFLRQRISPVRPFASDEGIHAFFRRPFYFRARASGNNTDSTANLWTARNHERIGARRMKQTAG